MPDRARLRFPIRPCNLLLALFALFAILSRHLFNYAQVDIYCAFWLFFLDFFSFFSVVFLFFRLPSSSLPPVSSSSGIDKSGIELNTNVSLASGYLLPDGSRKPMGLYRIFNPPGCGRFATGVSSNAFPISVTSGISTCWLKIKCCLNGFDAMWQSVSITT